MLITIYTRGDGALVLVPQCMLPPLEFLRVPLMLTRTIDTEMFPIPAIWDRVLDDIDEHSFAILESVIGEQMLDVNLSGASAVAEQRAVCK